MQCCQIIANICRLHKLFFQKSVSFFLFLVTFPIFWDLSLGFTLSYKKVFMMNVKLGCCHIIDRKFCRCVPTVFFCTIWQLSKSNLILRIHPSKNFFSTMKTTEINKIFCFWWGCNVVILYVISGDCILNFLLSFVAPERFCSLVCFRVWNFPGFCCHLNVFFKKISKQNGKWKLHRLMLQTKYG